MWTELTFLTHLSTPSILFIWFYLILFEALKDEIIAVKWNIKMESGQFISVATVPRTTNMWCTYANGRATLSNSHARRTEQIFSELAFESCVALDLPPNKIWLKFYFIFMWYVSHMICMHCMCVGLFGTIWIHLQQMTEVYTPNCYSDHWSGYKRMERMV